MTPLGELAIALAGIAAAALLASKLGQSAIPAFILWGVAFGPVGLRFVDPVQSSGGLSVVTEMGIILLLFYLGLDFSLTRFMRSGRKTFEDGLMDTFLNFTPGFLIGWIFGLGLVGSMFLGAIVYCTSTGIVAKVISDMRRTANPETEIILGLSIFQDLVIAVFIVVLSGLAFAGGVDATSAVLAVGKSLLFCVAVIAASHWLAGPIQSFLKSRSDEIFILTLLAMILGGAALGQLAGLSTAIGAFLTGLVFAETNLVGRIKAKVAPLKDLFVALLFFVFGLTIDFTQVDAVLPMLVLAIPILVMTKFATGIVIGRRRGQTERGQANIGSSLIAVGELSIVLAAVAVSAGYPETIAVFTAVYVLATALVGPVMMTLSHPISDQLKYTTGIGLAASDMVFRARMALSKQRHG